MRELFRQTGFTPYHHKTALIYPNALDARVHRKTGSASYETFCFDVLRHLFPSDFVIGPHVIDELFGSDSQFSNLVRPDAFIFSFTTPFPTLTHIIEMKSGTSLDLTRKITGFQLLLTRLRNCPNFLPQKIQDYIGEDILFPPNLVIPNSEDVAVIFMSQFLAASHHPHAPNNFRTVNFLKVPFEL